VNPCSQKKFEFLLEHQALLQEKNQKREQRYQIFPFVCITVCISLGLYVFEILLLMTTENVKKMILMLLVQLPCFLIWVNHRPYVANCF
jgi:hypothetical protein